MLFPKTNRFFPNKMNLRLTSKLLAGISTYLIQEAQIYSVRGSRWCDVFVVVVVAIG